MDGLCTAEHFVAEVKDEVSIDYIWILEKP